MDAFSYCKSLTSATIPDSVTSIGDMAFSYCDNLANITISNNLKEIKYRTFDWCISLEQIIIGDNVTTIGGSAFYKCDNLKSVTIGKGITKIGAAAFENCKNLNIITCKALTAPTVSPNTFGSSTLNYTGCNTLDPNVLYVPANSTGYEIGYWLDPLCNADKCGFTLSKTL